MEKICVFCGEKPENKNKEHVLPQWLLKLTGDPNRIVKFGTVNGKTIKFNWKQFTAPACTKCNDRYSNFEAEVKTIIEKICLKEEINGREAIKVLNWLDKVRIGLWLNYYFLEQNKGGISPRLCIDNRTGKKDRFLQIHFLESETHNKGLNAFGVETFLFQYNPSFFALKINNLILINGSTDFIISENCGFPFPRHIEVLKNGQLSLSDWEYNRETKVDIHGINLRKASLTLYQPIQTELVNFSFFYSDSYLILNCLDKNNKIGNIFLLENNKLKSIYELEKNINYTSVTGDEVSYIGEIVSQIYQLQINVIENLKFEQDNRFAKEIELNKKYVEFYNKFHEHKY